MTVVKPYRTPTDSLMELQKKAFELYAFALGKIEKDGILAKHSRYILRHIENHFYKVCTLIDDANRRDLYDEFKIRAELQNQARSHLANARTSVYCAYYQKHFKGKSMLYWDRLIDEVDRMLVGWMKSDRMRQSNFQKTISDGKSENGCG